MLAQNVKPSDLQEMPVIDFAPDVIHCNDWQTGLLPVFLKTVYGSDNFYAGIKTVFTIHNMKFQGRWKIKEVADVTGLPEHIFNSGELEFYGEANYLKGGIVYADEITTVSPTYADEICTPEGGEGLDGLMLERRRHLRGIVNGIDYDVFNPMKDTYLDKHFSVRELSGKVVNKRQLQEKYGLAVDKDVMLIGIVSRLTNQKGFDLVAYVMEEMLSTMNVQFIVQGTGEQQYEEMFNYFHGRYPQKLGVYIGAEKRENAVVKNKNGRKIKYKINRKPSTMKKLSKSGQYAAKKAEHKKSSVRAKVEHVFAVVKRLFGYRKTRYRGLRKQTAKLNIMFALANLYLADRKSLTA